MRFASACPNRRQKCKQVETAMLRITRTFLRDERGVVTTDWTALTAGMVLLGMAVLFAVMRSAEPLVESTENRLNTLHQATPVGEKPNFSN